MILAFLVSVVALRLALAKVSQRRESLIAARRAGPRSLARRGRVSWAPVAFDERNPRRACNWVAVAFRAPLPTWLVRARLMLSRIQNRSDNDPDPTGRAQGYPGVPGRGGLR